jgi:Uma2 family endonuclease
MSIAELPRKMTTEEFLALPDDGVERWLIRGELRENRDIDMNRRSPDHGRTCSNITTCLKNWVGRQPRPRGSVYVGDTLFKMLPDSDSTVGVDVAYVSPELEGRTPRPAKIIEGPPVIAVEVLSPSEKKADITEKIWEYLEAGVAQVWIADSDFQTITVFRRDAEPVAFNRQQELSGEPDLPGFRVQVSELFE